MRGLAHLRVVAAVFVVLSWPAPGMAQLSIESVRGDLRAYSEREFQVRVRFHVRGNVPSGEPLRHVGLLTKDIEVHEVNVTVSGVAGQIAERRQGQAFLWEVQPGNQELAEYEITYKVVSPTGRIPIPVPGYAATKPKTVHFSLEVPPEFRLIEAFPHFLPSGQERTSLLSNVPSFAIVRIQRGTRETLADRALSAETITNLVILALLGLFTGYWFFARRRRARESR